MPLVCSVSSFQELQASLSARSNEVNSVALGIQVLISERAQDLVPEQSRQLLGQLQQLQRVFHRASGQAQAWAGALSAQREREDERQRREKVKEEEKDRESARDREVWTKMMELEEMNQCVSSQQHKVVVTYKSFLFYCCAYNNPRKTLSFTGLFHT